MFNQLFTKTIVARDKDGNEQGYEYKAIEVAKDINIAITRERDGEIHELHLLDERGAWSGPSVTIDQPQVDYTFTRDEGERYFIRPATCNASSMMVDSTAHTRAQAQMLMLAADIADARTQAKTPELLAEIAKRKVRDAEREREFEAKQAAQDAQAAKLDVATAGSGATARIKLANRKSKLTGILRRSESGRNFFELDTGEMKDHRFHIADVEAAESRMSGMSRFAEVPLA